VNGALLWTSDVAAAATSGTITVPWEATGVSIDSRRIAPGDLFVALAGPNFDGHAFVADALAGGAAAALVSRRPDGLADDAPLLIVDDVMTGFEALGETARARSQARIAAITGSVGKTGTKEALARALSADGSTHASVGNLNNQWGVPLSLSRMPEGSRFAVFELGMNHAGEIGPLSRQVRPHVAIITTVAPVHLEFFDSVEQIADAKAEIFVGLEPGGAAILNRDNEHYARLRASAEAAGVARVLTFGEHEEADARLSKLVAHPACNCITADIAGTPVVYKVGAPGRHWALNSLAVLLASEVLGADLGKAMLALADMSAPAGRGSRHLVNAEFGSFVLIDESYNASPIAMRAAFDVLNAAETRRRGRRIAVLGDMLELGSTAEELHRDLAGDIAHHDIDLVLTCGPMMAELSAALPPNCRGAHTPDAKALLPLVVEAVQADDVVLVKGSLGMAMAPIVTALRELDRATAASG